MTNFWDYESQLSHNKRQAETWAEQARQHAGEFILNKQQAAGGLTTEARSPMSPANPFRVQLNIPETVLNDVQPGKDPKQVEKKKTGGILGGLEDLLRPVGRVLQAEQKYVAEPLAKALYTPFDLLGGSLTPSYEHLPGIVKSGLQVVADPFTYLGPGEITGVMKLAKLAPEVKLAAPVLETLFHAPGSRRLMVNAIKETSKRAGVGLGAVAGATVAEQVGVPGLIGGFAGAHLAGNVLRGSPVSRDWKMPDGEGTIVHIVNDTEQPVYHGTTSDYEGLPTGEARSRYPESMPGTVYASSSPEQANHYAQTSGGAGANVKPMLIPPGTKMFDPSKDVWPEIKGSYVPDAHEIGSSIPNVISNKTQTTTRGGLVITDASEGQSRRVELYDSNTGDKRILDVGNSYGAELNKKIQSLYADKAVPFDSADIRNSTRGRLSSYETSMFGFPDDVYHTYGPDARDQFVYALKEQGYKAIVSGHEYAVIDPTILRSMYAGSIPPAAGAAGIGPKMKALLDSVALAPRDFASVQNIDEALSYADYTRSTTTKLRSTMADYFDGSPEIIAKVGKILAEHNVRLKDTDITALINFHQMRADLGPNYGAMVDDELRAIRDNATKSGVLATADIRHEGSTASVVTDPDLVGQARYVAAEYPEIGLLADNRLHLGDLIENRRLFELSPEQNAIIDSILAPMAAHREYESYMGIPTLHTATHGDVVHRQLVKISTPDATGELVEGLSGPVLAQRLNARQSFNRPRVVPSISAGYAMGNKYLPFNESQAARVAQGYRVVADTWLDAALEGVGKTVGDLLPKPLVDEFETLREAKHQLVTLRQEVTRAHQADSKNAWIPPKFKAVGTDIENIIADANIASTKNKAERQAMFKDLQARVDRLTVETDTRLDPVKGRLKAMRDQIKLNKGSPLRGSTPVEFQGRYYPKDIGEQLNEVDRVTTSSGFVKIINEINDIARPIMATLDLSFMGVQGLVAALSHPTNYLKAAKTLFSNGYADYEAAAKADGSLLSMINAGGHWAARNDAAEFIFPSYFKRIPGIGPASDASNAMFTQFGNILRHSLFKTGWRNEMAGVSVEAEAMRRQLARTVNLITGFSTTDPGSFQKTFAFAPRYFRSQLGLIADGVTKHDFSNAGAARTVSTMMASGVMLTTMMNEMLGNDTSYDPADPNFMRVRFAGKDMSLFGPWDTLFRAVSKSVEEGDPIAGATYLARTKASPAISKVYDLITGEMLGGQSLSWGSPQDILESAGKMASTVAVPISIQSAIGDNIIPALQGDQGVAEGLAGTAVSFLGVKATPLSPSESMAIRRDRAATDAYGKPWSQLEPYQQGQLRKDHVLDNPSQTEIAKSFEFRRQIATSFQAQQQQLDNSLPIGHDWIDAYHKLQDQQVGAYAQWAQQNPEAIASIRHSKAKTPEAQALNDFYRLFDQADAENWTPAETSQRVADFRDALPAASSEYIDRNTGLHQTPRVKEYKAAQKVLSPYWNFEDQIWDRLKGRLPDAGETVSLQDYTNNLIGRLQDQGVPDRTIIRRIQSNPVIHEIGRATGVLRDRYRRAHPEADRLLQQWYGYSAITSQ